MIHLRKLRPRFLDVQLPTAGGLNVRIVERPGLWMAPDAIVETVEGLRSVVLAVLGGEGLEYGVFTGEKATLDRVVLTLVYEKTSQRLAAFNALSPLDVVVRGREAEVIHLGLAMVAPEFRGRGLSALLYNLTCLLLLVRNQLRPIWISNVSQVPSVVGMVAEDFSDVFPTADPERRRSFDHLVIAREIMRKHRHAFGVGEAAGFDEARFVITDAYTGGSDNLKKQFEEASHHRDEAYNEMCRTQLDYQVGDDFLQIGRIDLAAARKMMLRNIPAAWLPGLVSRMAVLFLERSLLPVIHWLTPSRSMGDLRPRKP